MKKIAKILIIGICFGLTLLVLKIIFGIDDADFMRGYWIAAPAIVVDVLIINVFYNLFFLIKSKKL